MSKIYINTEEELILNLIRGGKTEGEAVKLLDDLDEEIAAGYYTPIA